MLKRVLLAATLLAGPARAAGIVTPPVTANSPALAPYMHAPNPTIYLFGDSRISIHSISQTVAPAGGYPIYTKQPSSVVAWAQRFLGERLNWDLSRGYGGVNQAILKAAITAGGFGYSTSSACTGSGGATYGAPVVDGNGAVLSIPVMAGGGGYTAAPQIACTGGTGLNAVGVVGGSGTFGNVGETSCQAYARIPDVEAVAVPGDQIFIRVGTNDETFPLTLAQSQTCMKSIFDRLLADGFYVIYQQDGARLPWGAYSDANANAVQYRKQMYARRRWVRQYALADATKNTNGYSHFFLFDTFPEVADTTSAYGDPKPNYTQDGLHDSQRSAYIGGWKLAQMEAALLPAAPGTLGTTSQTDPFDATYNPGGALNPNPALTGTTGTALASAGGLTSTGTVPASYKLQASGTTGTQSLTSGFETTRTDGLNGARPQFVASCGGSGSALQTYSLALANYVQLAAAGVASGAKLRLDIDVEVSGQALMHAFSAGIIVSDNAGTVQATATDGSTSNSTALAIADSGSYDGAVPPLGAAVPLHFSTPVLALNNVGTTAGTQAQATASFTWGFDCSGSTAGSAGGTVKITRFALHPVP